LIVFALLGGAWADAMDRRLLLIIASWLAVASVLLWLQAASSVDNVWVVLSLLAVQQAFYAVNAPTRVAAVPRMVPESQLPAANSLNMTVTQFGAIVGPLLAGVLPIYVTFRLPAMPATRTSGDSDGTPRWGVGAVLAGFRYLGGNTAVLMSFVVDLIAMVLGMPRALFPQMAHESYGGPLQGGTVVALLSAASSRGGCRGCGARARRSSWRSWCGVEQLSVSAGSVALLTVVQVCCCGPRLGSWRSAAPRTWCRALFAQRSCSRPHPTISAAGCRAYSS
jgi:MFS family permease